VPTVFITGANRGIGLEFARQYAADGWRVIATARDPGGANELNAVEGDVTVRKLDLDSDFFEIDWNRVAGSEPIDLFINNAGVMGPTRLDSIEDAAAFVNALSINTVAPVVLAKAVLPLVAAAKGRLVALSSRMGSIDDNSSGGFIAYRATKAGLNAAWHSLALDVKDQGVIAATLHPGWVRTSMGGASAPLGVEESVSAMRRTIEGLTPEQSGGFYNYDGASIPW
jgi:NAD(P)-dependent dehydrogenase (short-subunit alcohol dehydrogenase family)